MIVYVVMTALGEMATWLPAAGGFAPYATRFVDPALGFSLGYTYWFKYIITTPNQLTAAALVIQYWCPPERVNPGVFIAVFLVAIFAINWMGMPICEQWAVHVADFILQASDTLARSNSGLAQRKSQ